MLAAQWRYRSFILGMVKRDFHAQYLNSVLGSLWAVLQPLSQILIYTLIFSQIMSARLPGASPTYGYAIFLCSALLPWHYFIETLTRCQGVFLGQGSLLKKLSFPRSALPSYVFLSSSVNFAIAYTLFLAFLLVSQNWPGPAVFAVLPLLVIQQALALGLGVFLGTLNVFFRDVAHSVNIVTQFWFWLTPLIYPITVVPEHYRWLLNANPMMPVAQAYQGIFLEGKLPVWETLATPAAWAAVALVGGYVVFSKLSKEMVDEL